MSRVIREIRQDLHVSRTTLVGLLSGFLQGTGLSGSDLRNQYLYAQDLKIAEVHGTTAMIGGANFLIASLVRLHTGQLSLPDISLLLYLFPVIFLATWLGKGVLFRIPQKNIAIILS